MVSGTFLYPDLRSNYHVWWSVTSKAAFSPFSKVGSLFCFDSSLYILDQPFMTCVLCKGFSPSAAYLFIVFWRAKFKMSWCISTYPFFFFFFFLGIMLSIPHVRDLGIVWMHSDSPLRFYGSSFTFRSVICPLWANFRICHELRSKFSFFIFSYEYPAVLAQQDLWALGSPLWAGVVSR